MMKLEIKETRGHSLTGGSEAAITGEQSRSMFMTQQTQKHSDWSPETVHGVDETVREYQTSGRTNNQDGTYGWSHNGNHSDYKIGVNPQDEIKVCVLKAMPALGKESTQSDATMGSKVTITHESRQWPKCSTWAYNQPKWC
jgi:hypothetical protein